MKILSFFLLALFIIGAAACSPQPQQEPIDAQPIPLEQEDPPVQAVAAPVQAAPPQVKTTLIGRVRDCELYKVEFNQRIYLMAAGKDEGRSSMSCAFAS